MKNELWEVGPRVARYRCVPENDEARRQLEAIGHAEFEAISIGRAGNGPQVAIIPLDESSREIAAHIVALHNTAVPKPATDIFVTGVSLSLRAITDRPRVSVDEAEKTFMAATGIDRERFRVASLSIINPDGADIEYEITATAQMLIPLSPRR